MELAGPEELLKPCHKRSLVTYSFALGISVRDGLAQTRSGRLLAHEGSSRASSTFSNQLLKTVNIRFMWVSILFICLAISLLEHFDQLVD